MYNMYITFKVVVPDDSKLDIIFQDSTLLSKSFNYDHFHES